MTEVEATLSEELVVAIATFQSLVGVMANGRLKAPHIGAALKGLELAGPKVPGHDFRSKALLVKDDKGLPVGSPADDVTKAFLLGILENFVQLPGKLDGSKREKGRRKKNGDGEPCAWVYARRQSYSVRR